MKAAILYVPVIHKGHLEFCQRQKPEVLYILGKSLISEFPFLERDLRALSPEDIQREARAISLAKDLRILEKENLSELDSYSEIIFSDDEVGKELAEKYFKNKKVIFDQTFLRWGSMKAVSKDVPDADQTISSYDLDKEFIQTAKDNSKKSPDWWRQVGALVVREGKIILSGYNKHLPSENSAYIDGDPRSNFNAGERIDLSLALHGEAGLIAEAARKGISLEGSSIYVTTFPCPNCAGMIVNAGIKKVYYSEGYSLLNAQENFKQAGVSLIKVI